MEYGIARTLNTRISPLCLDNLICFKITYMRFRLVFQEFVRKPFTPVETA